MRVLVVGPYPPPAGPGAQQTMQTVRRLAAGGDEVEVQSPELSAAHRHGPATGPRGAFELARRGRRYDAVYVHVGSGAPLRPNAGRARRLIDCVMWAFALRRCRESVLVIDDLTLNPLSVGGRSGRLLWASASRLLVTKETDRLSMHRDGGYPLDRIELLSLPAPTQRWDEGWAGAADAATAQALVRSRAAAERRRGP
jgi:hypothetical protein